MPGTWTPEPFEADNGAVAFERFVQDLPDFKFAALDAAVEQVLSVRGIELVRTQWLKALGKGLHEFRIRHNATEIARMFGAGPPTAAAPAGKILLRVFVHFHGDKAVLLLGGYDKGEDPSAGRQRREIAEARRRLAEFKQRRG